MRLFNDFFSEDIYAFISQRDCDFQFKSSNEAVFNDEQKNYLKNEFRMIMGGQKCLLPPIVNIKQVHADAVFWVDKKYQEDLIAGNADALLTNQKSLAIVIRIADCLPIYVYDRVNKCIGLIHAGWRSSQKSIVIKTIRCMSKNAHSQVKDMQFAFGPSIRSCCYEVGEEFKEIFPKELELRNGKYFLDIASINRNQLLSEGILENQISDVGICTHCDKRFFSYRREGKEAGRMLALMFRRSE